MGIDKQEAVTIQVAWNRWNTEEKNLTFESYLKTYLLPTFYGYWQTTDIYGWSMFDRY